MHIYILCIYIYIYIYVYMYVGKLSIEMCEVGLALVPGQGAAADLRDDPYRRAVRGCSMGGRLRGP